MAGTDPTRAPVSFRAHTGPARRYTRDIILGVNDGLVSIFLLIAGVVGGGLSADQVLLAGIAAAVAGAVSMAAGEFMATKSQEEVFQREREVEKEHIAHQRDSEIAEIRHIFGGLGFPDDTVEQIVEAVDADDEAFLQVMMALEFGIVDAGRRSPVAAMLTTGSVFVAGSLPATIPFLFIDHTGLGLAIAAAATGVSLFAVGVLKTLATATKPLRSGLENTAIAAVGAVLSYGLGRLISSAV
jgi:VIT1/CCC1 family predicted Fe2+/Mn2+ transporter